MTAGERDSDPRHERNRRILDVIRSLSEGEVVTYGDIAADAGHPGLSRLVGRLLAESGEEAGEEEGEAAEHVTAESVGGVGGVDNELPWWRVVNAAGRLVPGHEREQAEVLRAEGVEVRDGKVRRAPIGRFSRRSLP